MNTDHINLFLSKLSIMLDPKMWVHKNILNIFTIYFFVPRKQRLM